MVKVLYSMVNFLISPLKTFLYLRRKREQDGLYIDLSDSEEDVISFTHIVLVIWVFQMVNAFYSLFNLVRVNSFERLFSMQTAMGELLSREIFQVFEFNIVSLFIKILIIFILLSVIFFPLFIWFEALIIEYIIRSFYFLFKGALITDESGRDGVREVVDYSYLSYMALGIPIIGGFIMRVLTIYYLYVGMRKNLSFSFIEAMITMIFPIFIISIIVIFYFSLILLSYSNFLL